MKAVGYIRVSTVEQAQEGVSLDAQEARIRAYAEMQGLELVKIVRRKASAPPSPWRIAPAAVRSWIS